MHVHRSSADDVTDGATGQTSSGAGARRKACIRRSGYPVQVDGGRGLQRAIGMRNSRSDVKDVDRLLTSASLQNKQKRNLRECVDNADGFDMLEPRRCETVERAVKQIMHQLNLLAKLWKVVSVDLSSFSC